MEVLNKRSNLIKKNEGVTMITLVVTIILMVILTVTVTVNIAQLKDVQKGEGLKTDLTVLSEKVSQYYATENELPIINKYTNTSSIPANIKNQNDNENYYVIDLDKLNLSLNYGNDYQAIKTAGANAQIDELDDVYIINEQSHTIYYVKGVEYSSEMIQYNSGETYSNVRANVDTVSPSIIAANINYGEKLVANLSDEQEGISAWQITTSSLTPISGWTTITTTKQITIERENLMPGTYYIWAKDEIGNVSSKEVKVDKVNTTLTLNITGINTVGQTLTANATTASEGQKTYQWWYSSSNSEDERISIVGKNNSTYIIEDDYVGKYIGCTVNVAESAINKSITGNQITSNNINVSATVKDIYKINLNNNNATTAGTTEIYEHYGIKYSVTKAGEAMTTLANNITIPTKTGYTFLGYFTDDEEPVQYIDNQGYITSNASNTNFDEESTLNADWRLETYNISYNANGGTLSGQKTSYTAQDETFTLVKPTRTGYTFTGWTGSNGNVPQVDVVIEQGSAGDRNYTANWQITNYTITYNMDGGTNSNLNPATYNIETDTITLADASKEGYTFTGWTTEGVNTPTKNLTIANGSTGNKTFTANFTINQYTVTCEDWFVDGSNNRKVKLGDASKQVNYGTNVNGNEWGEDVTRSTYYTGYVYKSSTSGIVPANDSLVVYRYFWAWTDLNTYFAGGTTTSGATVSFSNDGTNWYDTKNEKYADVVKPWGTTYYIRNIRPVNSYEELDRVTNLTWDSTNSYYTYTPTKAGTKMCIYMKYKSYSVTYNYSENGGTDATKTTDTIEYGSAIDLTPTATKEGWTFVGWNTNKDATTGLSSLNMAEGNVTLYAIFSRQLTGTFRYYNNQVATSNVVIYNKATSGSLTAPAALGEANGYSFRHWSTSDAEDAASTVAASGSTTISANTTYYASYQKEITGTFYYCTLGTGNYTYSDAAQSSVTATAVQYKGYTGTIKNTNFTVPTEVTSSHGGVSAENYMGVAIAENNASVVTPTTANTTFYAVYTEPLTFYYYNGTEHTSKQVTRRMLSKDGKYSNSLSENAPTPSSYDSATYDHWSYQSNQYNNDYKRHPLSTGVNSLFAVYTRTITATFNYHNGTEAASTTASATRYYVSKDGGVNTYNTDITIPDAVKANRTISGVTYTYRGVSTAQTANATIATPTTANTAYYSSYTYPITVSYNGNNSTSGTAPANAEGTGYMNYAGTKVGISVTTAANPFSRTGYTYSKWNTKADGTGTDYNVSTAYTFTDSATLYAKWTANVYTITLNNQSAATAGTTTIYEKYNTGYYTNSGCTSQMTTSAGGISVPTKTGYTFGGYYTAENGTGTQYIDANGKLTSLASTTHFTAEGTLYAKWTANNYTLTVNPNGGTYNSTTSNSTFTQAYDTCKQVGVATPPANATVTFNGNGGTSESANATASKTFTGWTLSGTGSYVAASNGSGMNRTQKTENGEVYDNYSYTANSPTSNTWYSLTYPTYTYTSGHTYQIRFKVRVNSVANGGNITFRHSRGGNDWACPASKGFSAVTSGWQDVVLNATISGTTFTRSSTDSEQTVAPRLQAYTSNLINTTASINFDVKDLQIIDVTTDTLLQSNANMFWYRAGNGTLTANYSAYSAVTLPNATRTGYTFAGWYDAATGGNKIGDAGATYTPTENKELFAHWTANTYTVSFNSNSGSGGQSEDVTATYDSAMPSISTTAPIREGYTFMGWYDNATYTSGTQYYTAAGASARTWNKTAATTLYAGWKANTITVVFNKNNANATGTMSNQSITYNQSTTLTANAFSLAGFEFNGWNTSADGTGTAYANGAEAKTIATSGTVNLYAQWKSQGDAERYHVLEGYYFISEKTAGQRVEGTMVDRTGTLFVLPTP